MKPSSVSLPAARADLPMSFVRFLRRRSAWIAFPAVTCLALGPLATSAMAEQWDPSVSAGTALGGAGVWDLTATNWWDGAANVAWPNTATSAAVFGGAAGGAVAISTGTGVTANSLVFSTTGYTLTGTLPADVLNLAGVTPGIMVVNPADTATINAIITGTSGMSKSGSGTLALGGVNTFTGGTSITGGTLNATNLLALGASDVSVSSGGKLQVSTATGTWGTNVTLDNGTFGANIAGTISLLAGKTITMGAGGGVIEVGPSALAASKVFLGAGQLAGSGGLTKSGVGVLQLSGGNAGFSGPVTINSGTIEFQNIDSLGTAATTITVNNGGDIATGGINNRNNITLNAGGIISANNAAANYTGTVNVAGNATAALRTFQAVGTANSFRIDGNLSGGGTLNVAAPAAATLTLGTTPFAAGVATNNSAFTGAINAGTNTTVQINQALGSTASLQFSGGTTRLNHTANLSGPSLGSAGINASYYNMGGNPNASANPTQFASFQLIEPAMVINQIDPQINIPNGGGGTHPVVPIPGYQFNINDAGMWKGLLNITTAGNYQFSAINDDNAVLFVDGVQIGTIGVNAGGANVGAALNLAAGAHSVVWKFSQGGGGGYTQLRYNGPDTAAATVVVGSVGGSLTTGTLAPTSLGAIQALSGVSTLDTGVDVSATNFTGVGGSTLNLTSGTISDIVVTGASTLSGGGTVTINPNTASITFEGAIGDGGSATGLTINGLYKATFKGANTYTGLTTVNGGRLTLDTTGANSIAGDITVNAVNVLGQVRNLVFNQSNQIADTSTVNLQSGIIDLGANSDTVGTLNVSGGRLMGSGTITPTTAINLTGGLIQANLGGSLGITKTGTGTVTLSGNNTFTGQTIINAGAIKAGSSNALGAIGLGNSTTINSGGQLQVQGGSTIAEEIAIVGTGVSGTGALKNIGGLNTISPVLTLSGAASIESGGGNLNLLGGVDTTAGTLTVQGSGEVTITGAITGGGGIVKVGNGALTFNQNMSSLAGVTHTAGILGFNGPQSFGASSISAGNAYRFNSDPGAGVNITAPTGTAVIAGYAADQTLLSRVNAASAGAFALGVNSSNNLDFSTYPTLGLGASGLVSYSGTITPNAAGYRFSGAPASGLSQNVLRLTNALTGTNALTVTGGTVDLTGLTNTQNGAISVTGGTLRVQSNTELGAVSNAVTLNGGTLEYAANSPANGNLWFQLGNVLGGGQRTVNIGAAGGTISVSSFGYGNTLLGLSGVNPLTGSGTLTKTGFGHLFLNDSSTYSGNLVIAAQSANFEMRSKGSLPNVASVEVNQSSNFVIDNQNGWGQRQFGNPTNDQNRVNNAATITLKGGQLLYRSRSVAAQISETFGTVANPEGQNIIRLEKNGTVGGEIIITNLTRPVGGATIRFEKNAGTFGAAGDNPRIFFTNVNGAAPTTTNILGGWAYNTSDFQFVGYDTAAGVGLKNSTNTDQGAAAFTPIATNLYNLSAAGTATLSDAAANAHNITGLRFGNNAAQTLAFADGANDVLYIASGGILSSNDNQTRAIGTTAQRGKITAGTSTAAAGAKELFFHVNQNTTTVESSIIDNNGAVTVVKDLNGTVQLNTTNPYTGGTNVLSGRLNVAVAGGLGSGPVLVKGAAIELRAAGTTTAATGVFTGRDGSEIYLQNGTALYNTVGDRFVIEGGSGITGNSNNAGQNLASLTRIDVGSAFSAGGQIKLHPNAVVRTTVAFDGDIMTNMIANLGTNSDLYFNQSGGGGGNQFITLGQGTAWKGISSGVSQSGWNQGTINATSDFYLQGLTRIGSNAVLQLGNTTADTYAINNIAGKPINAFVEGQVLMNEDSPVTMSSDITFVVGAGGYLQPIFSNSFGSQAGNLNAKLLVQAGGTVDPGNFAAVGLAANQAQGFVYPVPSPINTNAVFEAGGRLIINDASGIGSTTGGATFNMKANSILELGTAQAFLGSGTGGLVNSGQFVFEPGTIIRASGDRIFKMDEIVNSAPNGKQTVLEIYGGNRNLTDVVDPRIVSVVGTPTVVPISLTYGNGGLITNDSADRAINERRGTIVLENGAVLAATSQTFLNIQEGVTVPAGATVNVGSSKYIDGNPKNGLVQFTGPQSNLFGAGAKLVVLDGSAFGMNAQNTFPDTAPIELPAAVTNVAPAGAIGFNPGNGSTLLPNVGNFAEIVGPVTGNGSVIANAGGTFLGLNVASDYTTNIAFRSANGQQAQLWKIGSGVLSYTGTSDSTGQVWVGAGELKYINGGNSAFGENRLQKGGLLTLDNTGTALSNRLGGSVLVANALNKSVTPMGGTLNLIGNASTAVEERFFTLFNSASGSGPFQGVTGTTTLKISPGAAATTILANAAENFQGAGIGLQKSGTYIINTPTVANAPMGYTAAGGITGAIVPGAGAGANGLVQIASPNFATGVGGFGVQAGGVFGSAGTGVAATRPDYLGDATGDGIADGFMTQDGVFYPVTNGSGTAILSGLPTTAGLTAGMLVQGSVPNGTRILSVDSPTQVTLTANTTAAATNMQFISGGMRNLAASEYSSAFQSNMNVGLNVKLSGTASPIGDTRVTSLTMTPGSILNIGGTLPLGSSAARVHLNSGGIFVQAGGTATINGTPFGNSRSFLQINGGASLFLHTQGDLNLNAAVFTDNAIVKTGAGTVNVGDHAFDAFRGSLQIDAGTVNLGTNNSFSNIRNQTGSGSNAHLYINGGTLNLGGNSMMINTLNNNNELPGMGGKVTSATPATLTVTGGGRFSGTVEGSISIDKNANNTLLLTSDNSYTGSTVVRSGTLSLRDSGKLSGTSALSVTNATLQLDNSYLSNVTDRVPATTPVTLAGGTINLTGAAGQVASQTLNNVTLTGGLNNFTSNAGGSGANVMNIGNLSRTAASGAVVNFGQNYGFLGTAGNNTTAIRNFITNVNGSPIALTNKILPAWMIANGDHFATYNATTGLGALGNTEDGYANYDSVDVTTALATHNVNDGAARTFAASKTINAWRMAPGAGIANTYNDGVGLTIASGGLLSNANQTISHAAATNARNNFITSGTGELDYWVNQNTNGINIPVTGGIDLVKTGPGGLNLAAASILTGTVTAGSDTILMANTIGLEVGDAVSGGAASTFPTGTEIVAITPGVSIKLSKPAGVAGADFRATFGNSYTGKTIVNGGTLTLNQLAAGSNAVAVPGDLYINAATVTEANVVGQLKSNANIYISGGGRLNMLDAAGVTETIGSVTFLDGSSGAANATLDRAASRLTSIINLSSPNALTSTNTNPSNIGSPFVGGFAGTIGFTNTGGSTINVNSPTALNGVLAVGLRIGARIGSVPTGVAEGGLIKTGTGLLVIGPDQNPTFGATTVTATGSNTLTGLVGAITGAVPLVVGQTVTGTGIPANTYIVSIDSDTSIKLSNNATANGTITMTGVVMNQFGNPTTLTDVFNIQSGVVRFDTAGAMGSNNARTTVQSGAVLLGSNTATTTMTGSVTLKAGSTMGATIQAFTLGAATTTSANQSVFNVPSGDVDIAAYDYYVPNTNAGNITINGKFTGAGTINIVGPQLTQGGGGGGTITFGNPILTGTGSSDFSGTINVGINAILNNQVATIPGAGLVRATGNALGTATINLTGGRLRLRDDLSGTVDVSNTTITYGNNVNLLVDSYMDANRASSTTATGNTINLGALTVTGNRVLNVDSGNNYQIGFSTLTGTGNLIKAGGGRINFAAIDPGFGGDIGMAGPVGLAVPPTFNTTGAQNLVLPATANLSGNFNLNGLYITEAGKTLTVANNFNVNSNPGNVSGMLAVTNTTILQADTFVNNGQVGAAGGTATITANGFMGNGHYLTNGQALNLAGGVTSGTLKVAGNNTVSITGSSVTPTATEVQSGVLRIAPNSAATTSGDLRVFGSPSSVASGTTAPIAAVSATLRLDGSLASISHTGNVTNNGLVQVTAGAATISGVISGTPVEYVPGLLEGFTTAPGGALPVDNTRAANPGNFGIRLEPRMLQTNAVTQQVLTGHVDNDTWIYTGYVKDDDGVFSFAENIDDRAAVWVDGALVLNAANGGGSRVVSTAFSVGQGGTGAVTAGANLGTPSQNFGPGITLPGRGDGWHLIEIRMNNGAGGSGPIVGNGFNANYGFGYKNGIAALDGADMTKPIDNGTGNLFVTPVGGKGTIQVDSSSTLTAGGTTQTAAINLNGGSTPGTAATVKLTGAAYNSDADALNVNGTTTPQGNVNADAGHVLSVPAINVAAGGNLNVNPTGGTGEVKLVGGGSGATGNGTGSYTVAGGTFNITTSAALTNTADVFVTGGNFRVDGTATAANVTVNGTGMLSGVGSVNSTITQTGGFISPGNSPGVLTTNGNIVSSGGEFKFEINGPTPGTGYDQLVLNGNLSLTGTTVATFTSAYTPNPMTDWFYLIKSSTPITGIFAGLAEGTPVTISGQPYYATYQANSATNSNYGGNDFALIPEPGSMLMMLFASFLCFFRRRRRE